jgi:hypothetical protein
LKRIIAIVGVVIGLGAIGLTAAHADNTGYSTWCTDGGGSSTDIPNGVVGLSYEAYPDHAWVCYSTTPNGSSSPEASGGAIRAGHEQTGAYDRTLSVLCYGDRTNATMVTLDCANSVWITDDNNPSTTGRSASGAFSFGAAGPLGFGRTGIDVSYPVTTTTSSGATPGGSTATGSGTCTYVNGTSPLCPSGADVARVNVATGDASVNPMTNPGGCITAFGNPCWTTAPNGAAVSVAEGDPTNDTVSTTVLGTPVRLDLGDCYGYNMPSGTC